jgi:hypothetical protein
VGGWLSARRHLAGVARAANEARRPGVPGFLARALPLTPASPMSSPEAAGRVMSTASRPSTRRIVLAGVAGVIAIAALVFVLVQRGQRPEAERALERLAAAARRAPAGHGRYRYVDVVNQVTSGDAGAAIVLRQREEHWVRGPFDGRMRSHAGRYVARLGIPDRAARMQAAFARDAHARSGRYDLGWLLPRDRRGWSRGVPRDPKRLAEFILDRQANNDRSPTDAQWRYVALRNLLWLVTESPADPQLRAAGIRAIATVARPRLVSTPRGARATRLEIPIEPYHDYDTASPRYQPSTITIVFDNATGAVRSWAETRKLQFSAQRAAHDDSSGQGRWSAVRDWAEAHSYRTTGYTNTATERP